MGVGLWLGPEWHYHRKWKVKPRLLEMNWVSGYGPNWSRTSISNCEISRQTRMPEMDKLIEFSRVIITLWSFSPYLKILYKQQTMALEGIMRDSGRIKRFEWLIISFLTFHNAWCALNTQRNLKVLYSARTRFSFLISWLTEIAFLISTYG